MNISKINPEVLVSLQTMLEVSAQNDLKTSWVLQSVLEEYPSVTRVEFRQSCEAAGINGLTARNVFDRVKK